MSHRTENQDSWTDPLTGTIYRDLTGREHAIIHALNVTIAERDRYANALEPHVRRSLAAVDNALDGGGEQPTGEAVIEAAELDRVARAIHDAAATGNAYPADWDPSVGDDEVQRTEAVALWHDMARAAISEVRPASGAQSPVYPPVWSAVLDDLSVDGQSVDPYDKGYWQALADVRVRLEAADTTPPAADEHSTTETLAIGEVERDPDPMGELGSAPYDDGSRPMPGVSPSTTEPGDWPTNPEDSDAGR